MPTKKRTLSVRLDAAAERRLEKAASLTRQSRGAFLEQAADESARRILLKWAGSRYRPGVASASELADDTGLTVEEIMRSVESSERQIALDSFLASCRTVAERTGNAEFLRTAETAARAVAAEDPG